MACYISTIIIGRLWKSKVPGPIWYTTCIVGLLTVCNDYRMPTISPLHRLGASVDMLEIASIVKRFIDDVEWAKKIHEASR